MSDFNAHHPAWGDGKTCETSNQIIDILDNLEFSILNLGQSTFPSTSYGTTSTIDLSIIHSSLIFYSSWEIGEDSWGSDHFPIFIHINYVDLRSIHKNSNRLYSKKKINWKVFSDILDDKIEENLENLMQITEPVSIYSTFTSILMEILKIASLTQPKKFNIISNGPARKDDNAKAIEDSPSCPWWNDSYEELVNVRKIS